MLTSIETPTTVSPFTCITSEGESEHTDLVSAIRRCIGERLDGNGGDVCGPQGWVYVDGRLMVGGAEWEVLEVGYDEGRGQLILTGYNRNAEGRRIIDSLFTWSFFRGQKLQTERYGLTLARVVDKRALPLMRLAGFEV